LKNDGLFIAGVLTVIFLLLSFTFSYNKNDEYDLRKNINNNIVENIKTSLNASIKNELKLSDCYVQNVKISEESNVYTAVVTIKHFLRKKNTIVIYVKKNDRDEAYYYPGEIKDWYYKLD
jgi:predicted histidine transporter YuiF (NhaC family)